MRLSKGDIMYSKNDYRYYLENQLMHSDDVLAHYGVRGMKWHKKKGGYTDNYYNHEMAITTGGSWVDSSGRSGTSKPTTKKFISYGQRQKKKDMKADRKQLYDNVDATNPYKYNKKKSIKKNIKSNLKVAKDRRKLKKIADKKVERYYNN